MANIIFSFFLGLIILLPIVIYTICPIVIIFLLYKIYKQNKNK